MSGNIWHEGTRDFLIGTSVIGIFGCAVLGLAYVFSPKDSNVSLPEPTPIVFQTETADFIKDNPAIPTEIPTAVDSGILNPLTGTFYPRASDPSNLARACVSLPSGGTVFGGMAVLGPNPSRFNDIQEAEIFSPQGASLGKADTGSIPNTFSLVRPGTVVCQNR
jgi:hypothetical protein